LEAIHRRYRRASRAQKQLILDEFCAVCALNRKYAIRLLAQPLRRGRPRKRPGRRARYAHPQLLELLRRIWLACDQPCSKRLRAAVGLWLPHYERGFGPLEPQVRIMAEQISAASIDRLLKPVRAQTPRKGLAGTKPGSLLKTQIPIRTEHWDATVPGFVEADTVAHCGDSLAGNFAWSLTLTDIMSGWTEVRVTWNKGAAGVLEQIRHIESRLPFRLRGFDCDNGSEFLNHHLVRYFTKRKTPVGFTRSRPYRKNDNAHVEQKNWSAVRQLLGYQRIDNPALIPLINDLYTQQWSDFINGFSPTIKLKTKQRIGARIHKTYEPPTTPLQRILTCPDIPEATKHALERRFDALNPFALQRQIQRKLRAIFAALPVTSNARQRP